MPARPARPLPRGLTLIETVISLALIAALLSLLLPALSSARMASYRDQCRSNQRQIGQAWSSYLEEHDQRFPHVPVQPAWHYAGCRFSSVDDSAFPDYDRPLNAYLPLPRTRDTDEIVCCCPADLGITDPEVSIGTGRRTAFRSFGTSYRANAALLDAPLVASETLAPNVLEGRSLNRREITTPTSRLVLMGDPIWYEIAQDTGRQADWHGQPKAGNILFLDGSVRFMTIKPRTDKNQAIVFDPIMMAGGRPATQPAAPAAELPPP